MNDLVKYNINPGKLDKVLKKYNIIMPKKKIYPYSLFVDYSVAHMSEDLRQLGEIIKKDYADYYPTFIRTFYCNNKLSHFNMFIMKYEDFVKYCEWLFGILAKAENVIDISNYTPVQRRIWGYMAERLLNVYVINNKMHIKYLPVNVYNDKKESILKYMLNRIRYNFAFNLSRPMFRNVWEEKK